MFVRSNFARRFIGVLGRESPILGEFAPQTLIFFYFEMSKIAIFVHPWDDLRKIFGGCQWITKLPNGEEKMPKISTGWERRTNVTDDRQTTDGRSTAYSEREREFTFAKK